MSKKFNIREWVLSVKYWSLLFIPHVSICLIFLIYTLVGASIIQEIESDDTRMTSSSSSSSSSSSFSSTESTIITIKSFDREREKLLSKIIDKRQSVDLQQYIKYVNKHIREYEEELKKTYKSITSTPMIQIEKRLDQNEQLRWSYGGAMYFIGTTLTTIGSNEFSPVTKIGKLFLMFYAAIGIPLTLVFLTDLSLLITRLIKYLSLLVLRVYSTKYFLPIRQWFIFRLMEKFFNISIPMPVDEEDIYSITKGTNPLLITDQSIERPPSMRRPSISTQHIQRLRVICNVLIETLQNVDDNIDLTMAQLISTLIIYILIGAYLISGNSYFDNIYICFTSLFSIHLRDYYRHVNSQEHNIRLLFIIAIYLLFGLAIVSLCIKAVQQRIQLALEHLGEKVLRDLVEFLRQMGFHELSTDEILATNESMTHITSDSSIVNRTPRLSRAASTTISDQSFGSFSTSTVRPIGIAEPLPRSSGSILLRTTKTNVAVEREKNAEKSVQVNTIIRSCGRCAGSGLSASTSALSLKRHSAISSSPSVTGDLNSSADDGETSPTLAPPNLDRLRQRRATLVAKTIINQMATQPSLTSNDEQHVASVVHLPTQRIRTSSAEPMTKSFKFELTSADDSTSTSKEKTTKNQNEFIEISKQISSLLAPSDDEN